MEVDRAAMAVDHLVFGPFDRGVEQIEVAQIGEAFCLFFDQFPICGSTPDAGQDHRDMERCQFLEFLGQQADAGARHRRDAAQVEDDELRARLGRELPGDVIDVGEGQRAHQLDDAYGLMVGGENVPLMRAAAAPRRALADIVVGDDAVARIVAAVEHVQIVMSRQRLANPDAAHAVAVAVELRRVAAEPEPRRQRRQNAAADAALGGNADAIDPFAGVVIHARRGHHRQRPRDRVGGHHLLAGDGILSAIGQRRGHHGDVARGHQDGALPEIHLQHFADVFLDNAVGAQEIADGAVAVAGRALGSKDRLIDPEFAPGEAAEC